MRGYECYVSCFIGDKFVQASSRACWGMLSNPHIYWGVIKPPTSLFNKDIYIGMFSEPETSKYQNFLISIINEITPCEITGVEGKEYIKFRMLNAYDRSLIPLNFIRNLWHEPVSGYATRFFDTLDVSADRYTDPVSRLTWANKEACTNANYPYGHSNVHPKASLRVRTKKELMSKSISSTLNFLTGK